MEKDYLKVFTTDQAYKANIAHDLLENNEIVNVILNQRDTVIPSFGDISIYVHKKDKEKAIEILKNLEE